MSYFSKMLVCLLLLSVAAFQGAAQVRICSWNLQNFGQSKSEEDVAFIAATVRDFDIVAVEEVMAGMSGVKAVQRLCHVLNKTGGAWRYSVSHATSSYENTDQRERYAFLWNEGKVRLQNQPDLQSQFEREIEREPFIATFSYGNRTFSVACFHALPKKKRPEKEIKWLRYFEEINIKEPLIFVGDFNCPQSHPVFDPLEDIGYRSALKGKKTTLKQECRNGECLASEYDNIFYPAKKMKMLESGVVPFHRAFGGNMRRARQLSDHLPVFAVFSLN